MKFTITNLQGIERSVPAPGGGSFLIGPHKTIEIDYPPGCKFFFEGLSTCGYIVKSKPSELDQKISDKVNYLKSFGISSKPSNKLTTKSIVKPTTNDTNQVYLLIKLYLDNNSTIVDFGTKFGQLKLPKVAKGQLSNNEVLDIPVKWSSTDYNPTRPGIYDLIGVPDNYDNPNKLSVNFMVTIKEQIQETQESQPTPESTKPSKEEVDKVFESMKQLTIDQLKDICDSLGIVSNSNKVGTLIGKIENSSATDEEIVKAYYKAVGQ